MPINKRESLIFTFIMCFCMVLGMSIYNVARVQGALSGEVLAAAWLGFPAAYVFAMLADWFVAGPLAKGVAFGLFVRQDMPPWAVTLIVSSCMVVPMVVIMSLFGCFEAAIHLPGGIAGMLPGLPMMWLQNIGWNVIAALPLNLLVAGPVARGVFRRAFPMGTVLAEPAPDCAAAQGAHADGAVERAEARPA